MLSIDDALMDTAREATAGLRRAIAPTVRCAVCGRLVRAQRRTRRYCSDACQKRAARARRGAHVPR